MTESEESTLKNESQGRNTVLSRENRKKRLTDRFGFSRKEMLIVLAKENHMKTLEIG